jgi:hypothetical protein
MNYLEAAYFVAENLQAVRQLNTVASELQSVLPMSLNTCLIVLRWRLELLTSLPPTKVVFSSIFVNNSSPLSLATFYRP